MTQKETIRYNEERFCVNLLLAWRFLGEKAFENDNYKIEKGLEAAVGTAVKEGIKLDCSKLDANRLTGIMLSHDLGFYEFPGCTTSRFFISEKMAERTLRKRCGSGQDFEKFVKATRVFWEFYDNPGWAEDYEKHKAEFKVKKD